MVLELVVQIADEGIPAEQVLVGLPLVENVVPLRRAADGVQHIAVALAVDTLLKRLDGQAQVHLVGGDILPDVGQVGTLQGVQKHQKAEDLVIGGPFRRGEPGVILYIRGEIDLLRDPEVVHSLAVPVADPGVFQIVEIVEVGGVASHHPAQGQLRVAAGVEQRLFHKGGHRDLLSLRRSSSRTPPPPGICCGHSRWS